MMRKAYLLPGVAAAGGIAGLLLRRVQLQAAFEPGTGLPIGGVPVTYALWAVCAATAAVVFALSIGSHRNLEGHYDRAFYAPDFVSLCCTLAAGLLIGMGGVVNMLAWVRSPLDLYGARQVGILRLVLGILCLLAAAGMLKLARSNYHGEERGSRSGWILLPGFAWCAWLMANYQSWAKNPVLGKYIFALLAIVLAMLAQYFFAGFAFGRARLALALMTSLLSVTFSLVALADGQPWNDLLLYAGNILALLPAAAALIRNDHANAAQDFPESGPEKEDTI